LSRQLNIENHLADIPGRFWEVIDLFHKKKNRLPEIEDQFDSFQLSSLLFVTLKNHNCNLRYSGMDRNGG
jgi:hypothetical protein